MKNKLIFPLFLFSLLFFSCISSNFTSYDEIPENYKTIYLSIDSSKTTILSSVGYNSSSGLSYYTPISTSGSLFTVKNKILIEQTLNEKGFQTTLDIEKADMILFGDNTSSEVRTIVTLALYDKKTEKLLFVAEGKYGVGMSLQGDINGALKKALEVFPSR